MVCHIRGVDRHRGMYPYVRFTRLFEHSRFLLFAIFADDEFKGFLFALVEFLYFIFTSTKILRVTYILEKVRLTFVQITTIFCAKSERLLLALAN